MKIKNKTLDFSMKPGEANTREHLSVQPIESLLEIALSAPERHWKKRVAAIALLADSPLDDAAQNRRIQALANVLLNRNRGAAFYVRRLMLFVFRCLPLTLSLGCDGAWREIQEARQLGQHIPLWGCIVFSICWTAGATMAVTLLFSPLLLPLSFSLDERRANRVRAAAAAMLGEVGDCDSINYLAAAMFATSAIVRDSAIQALCRLLPAVTPADYGRVSGLTIIRLCHVLNHSNTAFVVLVLQALGKIGDGKAVSSVQRLAETTRHENAREAAWQILPLLQKRQEEAEHSRLLLRAASRNVTSGKELVRPAASNEEAAPELLTNN